MLSSNNTIDIDNFISRPTAIVIQSGNTRTGDDLISLLVNEIYTKVVKVGKESRRKKLPRKIHCFLDEFANCNIADGPEYIRMMTTSRKFGMYWHMVLQCDAQLDRKFDPYIGKIIRANSTEIFMGSHDYDTEVRFAKSCGQKTIESLASKVSQQPPALDVVDVLTPEKLHLTDVGIVYVKSNRCHLLKTYIEAFYMCDEFVPVENISDIYPHNEFDYHDTAFFQDDLPPALKPEEFEVLAFLADGPKKMECIEQRFPGSDVTSIVASLVSKKALVPEEADVLRSNVTERCYILYKYRYDNGIISPEPEKPKPSTNPFDF